MRIITGKARGCALLTLEGEATRPTSAKAKEAIFSMLQFDIEMRRVLDLFAGSGQMGLEALSRGAASAVLIDSSGAAVDIITKNAQKTKLAASAKILCTDALAFLKQTTEEPFDLIFLDPPYAAGLMKPCLKQLAEGKLLKDTTYLICESGNEELFEGDTELAGKYRVVKKTNYGIAFVHILQRKKDGERE